MYYFFSYEKIFNYIKMKKKSLYEKNYNFDHISDIFNVNNVNKPEIQFNHKTNRCANKTTYNFLDWNNKNKTFEEGKINNLNCENSENENLRKNKLMKYNKSSIFIGNNDNSYIVKREKFSNNINPPKFYTNVSPYERKIYEVFGEEYNNDKQYCPNQKKITSFGSFNKEVYVQQNNDDYQNINPKMKKLNFLFNDNINNEKPIERRFKKIKRNYSTGNYDNLEPEKYNYHNLKNNYSSEREINNNKEEESKKINDNYYTNNQNKNNTNHSKNLNNSINNRIKRENFGKKNMINYNESAIPVKLDWKNQKLNLYYRTKLNENILRETAKDRKFNEFHGEKHKLNRYNSQKDFSKKDLENIIKREFPDENESKVKKRLENISSFQMGKIIRVNSMKNMKRIPKEVKSQNYEVKSDNINNLNLKEFEKNFTKAGIHIYDIRREEQYRNGDQKGKITFKVRKNYNDEDLNEKINIIKVNLRKNNIEIIESPPYKNYRKLANQIPSSIKWDNTLIHNFTKNRRVETTIQGKTHNKGILNENDKITNIFVNHKYKNH